MLCSKRQVYDGHPKIVQPLKILYANKPGAITITMAAFRCHRHRGKVVMVVRRFMREREGEGGEERETVRDLKRR